MIRGLRLAGLLFAAALVLGMPARADVYVDPPSFGRIVYGMTGGAIVLPEDAWCGSYPDGSGTIALPDDADFMGSSIGSGSTKRYAGDTFGTPGSNTGYTYSYVTGILGKSVNVVPDVSGSISAGASPKAGVFAMKLGYVSEYGQDAQVYSYAATGSKPAAASMQLLLGAHTPAGAISIETVDNPFGLAYVSAAGSAFPAYDYYSTDPAWNSGHPANTLYSHFKIYRVVAPGWTTWGSFYFAGFEDWNYDPTTSHHRFDWNDTVMMLQVVPEPEFYQLTVLLALGAIGLIRTRGRVVSRRIAAPCVEADSPRRHR